MHVEALGTVKKLFGKFRPHVQRRRQDPHKHLKWRDWQRHCREALHLGCLREPWLRLWKFSKNGLHLEMWVVVTKYQQMPASRRKISQLWNPFWKESPQNRFTFCCFVNGAYKLSIKDWKDNKNQMLSLQIS